MKKTAIAAAFLLATGGANAATTHTMTNGTFTFYNALGEESVADGHNDLQGTFDLVNGTGQFTTNTPFNGVTWVADINAMTFHSSWFGSGSTAAEPQTYTWTTETWFIGAAAVTCRISGSIDNCVDENASGGLLLGAVTDSYTYSLSPGDFAAHTFFDWSVNDDIPVLAVLHVDSGNPFTGPATISSTDCGDDTVPGCAMVTAPFPSQTPAFSGTIVPLGACTYTVSAPADVTVKAVTGTSAATVTIGTAIVTDVTTSTLLDPSAVLAPSTSLTPGSNVSFNTGVNTVVWDSLVGPLPDCDEAQTITVHDWNPPLDITAASSTPATGINLGVPTDFGGTLNPNGNPLVFTNDAPAEGFGPGATIVTWTATDDFGGTTTTTQNVTISLPAGIVGTDCVIDLDTAGNLLQDGGIGRLADGRFIMRDVTGSIVGAVDETVTGDINTTTICTDESCTDVGAALITDQSFFGFKWAATPIRLFGEGTWTFETCLDDGSTKCSLPTPLSMTVGPGQLGAHMLFEWSVNANIDVAVVWDVGCGKFELTMTDPDGDGILGSPMEDGPFKGFSAAFDINTIGDAPIAEGGYTVSIPVSRNPIDDGSPIPLDHSSQTAGDFPADDEAVRSCVGGCYDFETTDLISVIDPVTKAVIYKYAQVVIPLGEATPFYSVYRKYDPDTGQWDPFVINDRNNVQTASLNALTGACPEPGDGAYDRPPTGILEDKLRADNECAQLNIEDNGPNDLANTIDNVIRDPGGVAEVPEPPLGNPDTSGDTIDIGGCSISRSPVSPLERIDWWLLGGLLAWLGIASSRNRRQQLQ